MKKPSLHFLWCLFTLLIVLQPARGQVTNLMVNGSDTNFTMMSGEFLSWTFDIPVGGTADIEVWIDVDANRVLDEGTDRILQFLRQTDGVIGGEGVTIPDFDFTENGSVYFGLELGLAPASYILKVSQNGAGESVTGSVTPLTGPSFTISGTVTGPPGADMSYLLLDASRDDFYSPNFWNALTDGVGHYTIEMNSDTAGNPWWISLDNPPRPYIVDRAETTLTITGDHVGVDFNLVEADAMVSGVVRNEAGDSIPHILLSLDRIDVGMTVVSHWTLTDRLGSFWVGIPQAELNGAAWWLNEPYNSEPTTTQMMAMRRISAFADGDDLTRDLTVYQTNATVQGRVLLNGIPPGFGVMIFAQNDDTARSWALSDPISGTFVIPVSDRISKYSLRPYNIAGPYSFPLVEVSAGDSGVTYNILLVGVGDNADRLPLEFALYRNYPNPFNPATTIDYAVPERTHVKIVVYDMLGRTVAVLVDGSIEPGRRSVSFDAANLPGGMYICRMSAGKFVDVKKMLMVK